MSNPKMPFFAGKSDLAPIPVSLTLFGEKLLMHSKSAHHTYCLFKKRQIAFDMGFCSMEAVPCKHIFITHAHEDHSWGVMRHIQYRRLFNLPPAFYYVPKDVEIDFRNAIGAWFQLNGRSQEEIPPIIGLAFGKQVTLEKGARVEAIQTHHRKASIGFHLYLNRHSPDIPFLSYLGDHSVQTLLAYPELGKSTILNMELTFIEESEIEKARQYGHMHLNDLLCLIPKNYFQNDILIAQHLSSRYTPGRVEKLLRSKMPAALLEKLIVI